jgi:hypothetical protein
LVSSYFRGAGSSAHFSPGCRLMAHSVSFPGVFRRAVADRTRQAGFMSTALDRAEIAAHDLIEFLDVPAPRIGFGQKTHNLAAAGVFCNGQ